MYMILTHLFPRMKYYYIFRCDGGWWGDYCDKRCDQDNCAQCYQHNGNCAQCNEGYDERNCNLTCTNPNCATCIRYSHNRFT